MSWIQTLRLDGKDLASLDISDRLLVDIRGLMETPNYEQQQTSLVNQNGTVLETPYIRDRKFRIGIELAHFDTDEEVHLLNEKLKSVCRTLIPTTFEAQISGFWRGEKIRMEGCYITMKSDFHLNWTLRRMPVWEIEVHAPDGRMLGELNEELLQSRDYEFENVTTTSSFATFYWGFPIAFHGNGPLGPQQEQGLTNHGRYPAEWEFVMTGPIYDDAPIGFRITQDGVEVARTDITIDLPSGELIFDSKGRVKANGVNMRPLATVKKGLLPVGDSTIHMLTTTDNAEVSGVFRYRNVYLDS